MNAAEVKIKNELAGMNYSQLSSYAADRALAVIKLQARIDENSDIMTDMARKYKRLEKNYEKSESDRKAALDQNSRLLSRISDLTNELTRLKRDRFGCKSEKAGTITEDEDPTDEDMEAPDGIDASSSLKAGSKKRKKERRKERPRNRNRQSIPNRKLTTVQDYRLDADGLNKRFGEGNWRIIGWYKKKTKEVQHRVVYEKETYTPVIKYVNENGDFFESMPKYQGPFYKSPASASLVAQIMYDKFICGVPLDRQSRSYLAEGFKLPKSTMSRWVNRAAEEVLNVVYDEMIRNLLLKVHTCIQCDETYLLVIRDKRSPGSKSYIWCHTTSELDSFRPVIIFSYEQTRSTDHLRRFFDGLDHKIYLESDAYISYDVLQKEMAELIESCNCLAHSRRRYFDAYDAQLKAVKDEEKLRDSIEEKCIHMIGQIYHEDNPAKDMKAEERQRVRTDNVKPLVDEFFSYIKSIDLDDPGLSSPLADAISYSLNHEEGLRKFLEDPMIPIDNNFCERAIKSIALARRNYLFCVSPEGAECVAIIQSVFETARANGASPLLYMQYLLEKVPPHLDQPDDDTSYLKDMMPWSESYRAYEKKEMDLSLTVSQDCRLHSEKPKTPKMPKRYNECQQSAVQMPA